MSYLCLLFLSLHSSLFKEELSLSSLLDFIGDRLVPHQVQVWQLCLSFTLKCLPFCLNETTLFWTFDSCKLASIALHKPVLLSLLPNLLFTLLDQLLELL